jgi:hypothetical protein
VENVSNNSELLALDENVVTCVAPPRYVVIVQVPVTLVNARPDTGDDGPPVVLGVYGTVHGLDVQLKLDELAKVNF